MQTMLPRHLSRTTVAECSWLKLDRIAYLDVMGKERSWEMVSRIPRGGAQKGVDAVAIFPRLFAPGAPDKTVIVKQYRPPIDSFTLENPAGLVDAGETLEQAALRELKEETGYTGIVQRVTPPIYSDPGLSASAFSFVFVDVDLADPINQNVKQDLDEGERIEVLTLPIHGLFDIINEMCKNDDRLVIDAKFYSLAMGMAMNGDQNDKSLL